MSSPQSSASVPAPARGPTFPAIAAGTLAAVVGFASSLPVALQGLIAAGASQTQAASGLMALSFAMGIGTLWASARSRMPISLAWSTPGAALLAAQGVGAGGFAESVGAFLVSGALVVAAGSWRPLGRAVAAIPNPLASAMLAGVLFGLCVAPVKAVAAMPLPALAIVAAWAVTARINRLFAVPVALVVAAIAFVATSPVGLAQLGPLAPEAVLVVPSLSIHALTTIALPLFVVTMASQNIPGIAVLAVNGYRPAPGPLFRLTGIFSILAAPFGGHAVSLAAITAALCAGPDAEADPARRWWAAAVSGIVYCLFGLCATAFAAFLTAAPPLLIQAVAGLALIGSFAAALTGAVAEKDKTEAAMITFVITASGVGFLGIGGALWGLLAGGAFLALQRWRRVG